MRETTGTALKVCYRDGDANLSATVKLGRKNRTVTFDRCPELRFKVSYDNEDRAKVILPTDKPGAKPYITCEVAEINNLASILEAADRQIYLGQSAACGFRS